MSKKKYDIRNDYKKFLAELSDKEAYIEFEKIYYDMKAEYIRKIENEELDLDFEKARLEMNCGKYDEKWANFGTGLIVSAITILLNGITVAYSTLDNLGTASFFVIVGFNAVSFFVLLRTIINERNKNNDWINGLALRVLNDIEQEMKEQKEKQVNKIQYNGCNWIGSNKLHDFSKGKNNNMFDIGVWIRFVKELRRLGTSSK